jgi:preprotein translocase subunit Sec63
MQLNSAVQVPAIICRKMTEDIHTMETTESSSLYEVLGCTKEASSCDLKKAYRKLALQLHPDKNLGDEQAAARFQRVSRAYDVLGDPQKRQFYDNNGLTEELDVSAEDWMASFAEMVFEFTGGMPMKVCYISVSVCHVCMTAASCMERASS